VTPVVVCRSETWPVTGMDMERLKYIGGENTDFDIWASGRTRDLENKD